MEIGYHFGGVISDFGIFGFSFNVLRAGEVTSLNKLAPQGIGIQLGDQPQGRVVQYLGFVQEYPLLLMIIFDIIVLVLLRLNPAWVA